jgi:vacuolar-type H+-ATPase subunit H
MPEERPSGRFESVLDAVERAATEILDEAEAEADRRVAEAEARAERIAQEKAEEVTRLTDSMLAHAKSVNERADELLNAIDAAMRELGDSSSPAGHPLAQRASTSAEPAPSAEDSSTPPEPQPAPDRAAGATEDDASAPGGAPSGGPEPLRTLRERFNQIGRPPRQLSRSAPASQADEAPPVASTRPREAAQTRSERAGGGQASEGAVLLATQMAVAGGSREQIEERLRNDFGIEDPGEILDRLTG